MSAQLARADAYTVSGQYEKAHAAAADEYALAVSLNWREIEVSSLNTMGLMELFIGRLDEAAEHLATALRLLDTGTVTYRRSTTLNRLGIVHGMRGALDQADDMLTRALADTRANNGGPFAVAVDLSALVIITRLRGRHDEALAQANEALQLQQSVDATHAAAVVTTQLAKILRDYGRLEEARQVITDAITVLEPSTDTTAQTHARLTYGTVLAEQGELDAAVDWMRRAETLARTIANRHFLTESLIALAALLVRREDWAEARRAAQEALETAQADGFRLLAAQSAVVLAHVRAARNEPPDSALERAAADGYAWSGHRPAPCPVSWLPALSWP
jgi:tetratricopeptide (TPR) repeat protein